VHEYRDLPILPGRDGTLSGVGSSKKAAGPATGLAGFKRRQGKKWGVLFFWHIFRVLRHYAMCLGTGDRCTERQQPQIVREKETFWKVRTFVRTRACGEAHVTTFGPTERTARTSKQSRYFS